MRHIFPLFVTILLLNFSAIAQSYNRNYNKIGVSGGYLFSDIDTDDLPLSSSNGFTLGLETRGSYSRTMDFIYAVTFYNQQVDLQTVGINGNEVVNMTQQSVQLQFLASYNIFRHHLSVEAGPAIAVQGKFKPGEDSQENNLVAGYTLTRVEDLRNLSTVDFRLVGGLTFGIEPFRISLLYMRGLTNTLNALNGTNPELDDLKGNNNLLALRGIIYF